MEIVHRFFPDLPLVPIDGGSAANNADDAVNADAKPHSCGHGNIGSIYGVLDAQKMCA